MTDIFVCLVFSPFLFQRHIFSALSQIAKHSVDLAEMVVEAEIFPSVLTCLKGEFNIILIGVRRGAGGRRKKDGS